MEVTTEELDKLIGYHRSGTGYNLLTCSLVTSPTEQFKTLGVRVDVHDKTVYFCENVNGNLKRQVTIPIDDLFELFPLLRKALSSQDEKPAAQTPA